jgi:hemerythrin superfamily protein
MDVIELLEKDHAKVRELFKRFNKGNGRGRAASTVDAICSELEMHAQLEEEIFYPAVRELGDEKLDSLVDESLEEHGKVKEQVSALRQSSRDGDELESQVSELEECVEHHVDEEEGEMFPRLEEVMDDENREELGRRIRMRKGDMSGESEGMGTGRSRSSKPMSRTSMGTRGTRGKTGSRAKTSTRGRKTGRKAGMSGGKSSGRKKRSRAGRGR